MISYRPFLLPRKAWKIERTVGARRIQSKDTVRWSKIEKLYVAEEYVLADGAASRWEERGESGGLKSVKGREESQGSSCDVSRLLSVDAGEDSAQDVYALRANADIGRGENQTENGRVEGV